MSPLPQRDRPWVETLSLDDFQRLVERLPAAQRAEVAWAPKRIRDLLDAILAAPEGPAVEDALVESFFVFYRLGRATPMLASDARLRGDVDQQALLDLKRLRDHLTDDSASDAAEWATRAWMATADFFMTFMAHPEAHRVLSDLPEPSPDFLDHLARHPLSAGVVRTQTLLMAAFEGVKRGTDRAIVTELAWRAYEEAHALVDALRTDGVIIDPFRNETAAERGARAQRYARHVRAGLSDGDDEILRGGRVGSVR